MEQYHDTVSAALKFISDAEDISDTIPTDAKLAFFNETRHAYGRTALLLSVSVVTCSDVHGAYIINMLM